MSKGQAINIDFTVGLGLFLVSILGGLLFVANSNIGGSSVEEARQKASLVQQELEEQTYYRGEQAPLIVRTPSETGRIPVDRSYVFPEEAYAGTGSMDIPADIDIGQDRVVTVVDGRNSTHQLNYFYTSNSNISYSNDIETGAWMNNSMVSVRPGNPGIQSLRVNGNEVLNPDADLNGNSFTVTEHELHASTLGGDLKLYNGSRELILENPGTVTFDMKNFTTLYWHRDGSTTELTGTGTFKSGTTSAFTAATYQGNEYGVTFLGKDMDATVSKPDSSTVRASIDAPRLRIYLHDSNYTAGRWRAEFFSSGKIVFGAEKKLRGASRGGIERLENIAKRKFENLIGLEDFDYNITYGGNIVKRLVREVKSQRDWNTGKFDGTSADREDNSGTLGIGYLNGTRSGQPNDNGLNGPRLEGFYRFDRTSGAVVDYSGNQNDGSNSGAARGSQGVFGTDGFKYRSGDTTTFPVSPSGGLNDTFSMDNIAIAFWIKPQPDTSSWDSILKWSVTTPDGNTYLARTEMMADENDSIYTRFIAEQESCGDNTGDGGFWARNSNMGFTPGDWNLYTVTYNGNTIKEYSNGGSPEVTSSDGCNLADIGTDLTLQTLPNGQTVDNVMFFNKTLSQAQITRLYHRGVDGTFNGNYTAEKIDNSQTTDWTKLQVDATIPADTALTAKFTALDTNGNVVDSQLIDLSSGKQNYTLKVEESEYAKVKFKGSSTNVTKTWEIVNHKVFYESTKNLLARGSEIPYETVVVSDRPSVLLGRYGNYSKIENRVALWR